MALALSGCARFEKKDPDMTPEESNAQITELFERTIVALGGGEWSNSIGGAEACVTAAGNQGAQFIIQRIGPGSRDPEGDTELVRRLWVDAGFATTHALLDRGTVQQLLHPRDANGLVLEFNATEHALIVFGQTVCAPGDDADYPGEG
ncbi:hypothetical protein [Frondihabitans cladoniiphilus]|uniref:LppA-like lipoprotein n=1 Tax=Frondihabitans cladoniiphilus TaxID=715785 RepID=A0ABP8WAK8_9MICO